MLLFAEIQTGTWLRTGSFLALTLQTIKAIIPWQFGADLLLGSTVIGSVLGCAGGLATYLVLRGGHPDPLFDTLARRASDRYVATSITAWEFARGKLRGDPLYREALFGGWLPSGGRLLDVGCGQGLVLALLAEAERMSRDGAMPPGRRLPCFERMVGVELRPHRARLARKALGSDADIVESDARTMAPGAWPAVLLFDVLHMMSEADQDALLSAVVSALEPGGVILVREADASAGWGFEAVRIGNRLTALASGAWRQPLSFRTVREWRECFSRHGLDAEGTPSARVPRLQIISSGSRSDRPTLLPLAHANNLRDRTSAAIENTSEPERAFRTRPTVANVRPQHLGPAVHGRRNDREPESCTRRKF